MRLRNTLGLAIAHLHYHLDSTDLCLTLQDYVVLPMNLVVDTRVYPHGKRVVHFHTEPAVPPATERILYYLGHRSHNHIGSIGNA